jgi:hypothetical protein
MQMFDNPATTIKPRLFGRGRQYVLTVPEVPQGIADDVRLFAMTFACGFLFMSVFLA